MSSAGELQTPDSGLKLPRVPSATRVDDSPATAVIKQALRNITPGEGFTAAANVMRPPAHWDDAASPTAGAASALDTALLAREQLGVSAQYGISTLKQLDVWPSKGPNAMAVMNVRPSARRDPVTNKVHRKPVSQLEPVDFTCHEPQLAVKLNRRLDLGVRKVEESRILDKMGQAIANAKTHREVLEDFSREFKAYQPLLLRIMTAFDTTVEQLSEEIKVLRPLKEIRKAIRAEYEQCMKEYAQRDAEKSRQYEARIAELEDRLLDMSEVDKQREVQVDRLSKELSLSFAKYKEQSDARKVLESELNDIHFREEDMAKATKQKESRREEDPVLLEMRVNRLQADLQASQQKLVQTIADYGDVVPRREFDKVTKSKRRVERELRTLRSTHDKLLKEHRALKDADDELLQQRDTIASEYCDVQRACTPRPDWDVFEEHFTVGEDEDWSDVRDRRTSQQMAEAVLAQLKKEPTLPEIADGKYGPQVFRGKGTGTGIVLHMRAEGVIRNRCIRRKELLVMIDELWSIRLELDDKIKKRTSLTDQLWAYLEKRYVVPTLCMEWAYSFDDACQRYSAEDAHVALFHAILNKQMDESTYTAQLKTLRELEETLLEAAALEEEELPSEALLDPEERGENEEEQKEGEVEEKTEGEEAKTKEGDQETNKETAPADCAVQERTEEGEQTVVDNKEGETEKETAAKTTLLASSLSEFIRKAFPIKNQASIDDLCDCAVDEATVKPTAPDKAADGTEGDEKSETELAKPAGSKLTVDGAAEKDDESVPVVDIARLFKKDDTGYTSEFVHLLREQERQEKMEYLADIAEAIGTEPDGDVTMDQLQKAVQTTDPEKPEADINQILAYAFATTVSGLSASKAVVIQLSLVLERLQTRAVQRFSGKPAK